MDPVIDFGTNMIERETIQSPTRLRRQLSTEETDEIKADIRRKRYELGWDDSMFFTSAQAAQVEAKKILKMGALKNKK